MARLVVILVVGALLLAGCGGAYGTAATPTSKPAATSAPGGTPAAGDVEVTIQGFAFNPNTVTVASGTTVRWTQKDSAAHTVTSDKGAFDSGNLSQGKTFSFKFSQPGTHAYHCSIHPNMKGTVNVQ